MASRSNQPPGPSSSGNSNRTATQATSALRSSTRVIPTATASAVTRANPTASSTSIIRAPVAAASATAGSSNRLSQPSRGPPLLLDGNRAQDAPLLTGRRRKRNQPLIFNSFPGTAKDKESDFTW